MERVDYKAGSCNIGNKELRQRVNPVIYSLVISIVSLLVFEYLGVNQLIKALLFFPLAVFLISVQQLMFNFCIGFAFKGVYNFTDPGNLTSVENNESKALDKKKAIRMIVYGTVLSIIITAIYITVFPH